MTGLNLSFSHEDYPSPKLFFLGALAGLAKAGVRAGARAGAKRPSGGAIRPRPHIPSAIKLRTGDINITTNKKENEQPQQPQ